jgi:ribosomal protein S27E
VGVSIMDIDKQINLGHLLLNDRKCRVCGEIKNLVDGFYRTRKNRGAVASSYSYECKDCTIKRIVISRMQTNIFGKWEYPDW